MKHFKSYFTIDLRVTAPVKGTRALCCDVTVVEIAFQSGLEHGLRIGFGDQMVYELL